MHTFSLGRSTRSESPPLPGGRCIADPLSANTPFFIVGSGRSGSTLLRIILSSHSCITIPPETWFLLPLVEQLPIDTPLRPAQVESAVEIMTSHYRWPDLNIDRSEFAEIVRSSAPQRLRDLVDLVYRRCLERENKPRWGDKTPPYIRIVPELARLYPDARFLHLVRDGHDVTQSFQARGWGGRWLYQNTAEWQRAVDHGLLYGRTELAHRIKLVRYEDLVLGLDETVRGICEFLGEAFEPGMLDWQRTVDQKVPAREAVIHKKLYRRPRPEDVFRWKREMDDREVFITESFLAHRLQCLGYDVRFRNPLWSPAFAAVRVFCRSVLPLATHFGRVFRFARRRVVALARSG